MPGATSAPSLARIHLLWVLVIASGTRQVSTDAAAAAGEARSVATAGSAAAPKRSRVRRVCAFGSNSSLILRLAPAT